MRTFRFLAVSIFLFLAFIRETHGAECEDLQDWCKGVQKSFCDDSADMRKFCPKKCDTCLPPGCDECEHNCTVRDDETHECTCLKGWRLMGDRTSCVDIDECQDPYICSDDEKPVCRNFPGAYECIDDKCQPFHGKDYIRSLSYKEQCCKRTIGATCGENIQNKPNGPRVIGGQNATNGMWPWQAFILLPRDLCGGSLINTQWLVSAAHCFERIRDLKTTKLDAWLGVVDTQTLNLPSHQKRSVTKIILHENYDFPKNDIALVKLNEPVKFSDFVRPVCLPNGEVPAPGTMCYTTGYGVTVQGSGKGSRYLQQVDVPIVDGGVCKKAYNGTRDIHVDKMVCAGYKEGGKDACQGDSGGPLVCQRCNNCDWFLAGVTSFGEGCATPDFYGVYANVVNYETWIESKIASVKIEKSVCEPTQWTAWGDWTRCTSTCAGGKQTRIRLCKNGEAGLPGCLGKDIMRQDCNTQKCGADSWSDWTSCSKTCGSGEQSRRRVCVTSSCRRRTQTKDCNTRRCESWRTWSQWTTCSKTCGGGERKRTRSCSNGSIGQAGCQGPSEQTEKCNEDICPKWTAWSRWSQCPVTCGGGRHRATRKCLNGEPALDCPGLTRKTKRCNTQKCTDTFGQWSKWTKCSQTCGDGTESRTRTCPSGNCVPDDFGSSMKESRSCNIRECVGVWTAWSPWDVCSRTCGSGTRSRIRTCIEGSNCPGEKTDTGICNTNDCLGTWTSWSAFGSCDVTCGPGRRVRTRTCNGVNCPGRSRDEERCLPRSCPVWSDWSDWNECSATCEGGQQSRTRICGQRTKDAGLCPGESSETQDCGDACEISAQCSEQCTELSKWGYCVQYPNHMDNFCEYDCCRPAVCKDRGSTCTTRLRCHEPRYFYDCTATCGFCPP